MQAVLTSGIVAPSHGSPPAPSPRGRFATRSAIIATRRTRSAVTCTRARRPRLSFGASPTSQWERSPTGAGTPATLRTSGMPSTDRSTIHRYAELTWPEIAERAAGDPVCVIPVATLEDHGYHLPVDTDAVIAETLAERAVLARPGQALLLPTVTHGYTPHHMDFPGSITIDWKRFVDYLVDIGSSLIHHGFRRILFVNGHGSNVPLVDIAARLLMLVRRDAIAAPLWDLSTAQSAELLALHRGSGQPRRHAPARLP